MDLGNLARVRVLDHVGAGDVTGATQAHLASRRQPEKLAYRFFHKVGPLNIELAGEGDLPGSGRLVFRVVKRFKGLCFALGIVIDDDLHRVQYSHGTQGVAVQVFPYRVLQQRHVGQAVDLGDADTVAEGPDSFGGVAAPAQPGKGRHARVVPATDMALFHQLQEQALAHERIGEGQPRKLDLAGMVDLERVEQPVVEGAVHFKFQRAERMGDALDRVFQSVGEIVGGVDTPGVAGPVVVGVANPVDGGITQMEIG